MKKQSHIDILTSIGLSNEEASLYLAMLASGPSTVLKLARTSGLKRSSIYGYLEKLRQLGVARIDVKGFKREYVAEHPEKLSLLLKSREELLIKSLPDFEELYQNQSSVSFIKYYEGVNAVKQVYEGLLESLLYKDEYLAFSNQEKWLSLDEDYFKKYQEKREKKNLKTKLILQNTPSAIVTKRFERNIGSEVKVLGEGISLDTNLIVTKCKVVIHDLRSPTTAIVIENESVVRMHKAMFEMMWGMMEG
jgi:sugar-specific transcriptional regulator TrmB